MIKFTKKWVSHSVSLLLLRMSRMENKDVNYTRLLWRAHRGMLELDLLLIPFIEKEWFNLSENEQKTLEKLLESQDPDLYAWIMGHEVPQNKEFMSLADRIRHYKQTAV